MIKSHKIRDLNYFEIDGHLLVFACDSSGAVGCLEEDESYRDPEICGMMYPKCVLMELLACGIEPIAVYNDFCYEKTEDAERIIHSIGEVIKELGLSRGIIRNSFGSFKGPRSTAYGVSAVGIVKGDSLRTGRSQPHDIVCAYSVPSWRMDLSTQTSVYDVKKLAEQDFIHEILPCGSHGFHKEACSLAEDIGLSFKEYPDHLLYEQGEESCGASAVVLVTLKREDLDKLIALKIPRQLTIIGELVGTKTRLQRLVGKDTSFVLEKNGDLIFDNFSLTSVFACDYGKGKMEKDERCLPETICERLYGECLNSLGTDGYTPLLLVNDLNFAMRSGGRECIDVLRDRIIEDGLSEYQLTGSTEDNHVAVQSGYAMRLFVIKDR